MIYLGPVCRKVRLGPGVRLLTRVMPARTSLGGFSECPATKAAQRGCAPFTTRLAAGGPEVAGGRGATCRPAVISDRWLSLAAAACTAGAFSPSARHRPAKRAAEGHRFSRRTVFLGRFMNGNHLWIAVCRVVKILPSQSGQRGDLTSGLILDKWRCRGISRVRRSGNARKIDVCVSIVRYFPTRSRRRRLTSSTANAMP